MTIGRCDFVVFSDDWGVHPSSSQHLFRHIAREHSVLWVNTIGMRNPTLTLSDLLKAIRKITNMVAGARRKTAAANTPVNLQVCQPFMLPFSSLPLVRAFNRRSVLRTLRVEMKRLSMRRPIVVSSVPNACDFVRQLDARRVVYYCVDDFSRWPGLDHQLVAGMESDLIARSDVLIATSAKLLAMLSARGSSATLLTHGVDLELFAEEAAAEHPCLAAIPRPRIGYFGLFDERSDQSLLLQLARKLPEHSFVITGPVAVDAAALRRCPNVHFTGPVAYGELPSLVRGLQALFIPYVVNSFTDAISPLKLKEYLVTGRPVIVTAMAEALPFKEQLCIASTVDEWVAAIRNAAAADPATRRQMVLVRMQNESWAHKARRFIELCSPGEAVQVPA